LGKSISYRQYAAECRAVAETLCSGQHRLQLLNIAAAWDSLAAEAARRSGVSLREFAPLRLANAR
jgi:hypothetical protein